MKDAERLLVPTSHATIAVFDRRGPGLPIVLIHGNSSCKEVFALQFESPVLADHRMMALDLPGHGASEDAHDPERTYSLGGYAEAVTEVLAALRLERAVVMGWSLGGHVGLELIPRYPGLAGLMIVGAPPFGFAGTIDAKPFSEGAAMRLTGQETFDEAEVLEYARATCGVGLPDDPQLIAMCARTDGRARRMMLASVVAGRCLDEVELVAEAETLLAVLNGADDPFLNLPYLDRLTYRNLWRGKPLIEPGAGHAPFRETPERFNLTLSAFVRDAGDAIGAGGAAL